jgi:transcriptional regulator with XRE-family HTH domain
MDLITVLANIERLLKAKKRSADAVSRAAGVNDAIRNLRRTVRGEIKAAPTARTIAAIAAELGVTVDYLMMPREKPDIQPAPGVREAILEKIKWLDQQREQALAELAALDEVEKARNAPKRRIR